MTKKELCIKYILEHPHLTSNIELARLIIKENKELNAKEEALRVTISKERKRLDGGCSATNTATPVIERKQGLEVKGDNIVVNWTTRTVITDLGEFGNMVVSFDTHSRIQRAYVHADGNETAAIVAMNFDFPHAKAVHLYAKYHGFTKSSIPQTDLEFEEGLTAEQAVEQNIQALKRKVHKQTEKEKWKFIQKAAENWLRFEHNIIEPFNNYLEGFNAIYQPIQLDIDHLRLPKRDFAVVLGLSDWHFMKLCYNEKGEQVYNKDIARTKIKAHMEDLMAQVMMYGRPTKIYVPVGGNDNIHIDGPEHTTTAGTKQIDATDGIWRIGIGEYLDINIDYIECLAQIAPVEVACFPGNHDEKTSTLMALFLSKLFAKDERVTVTNSLYPRLYFQYEKNCIIFTHGHHLTNSRLQKEIHKIILGEAKQHGIDLNHTDNYLLFTGHDHVGSFQDLNGNVQHFIMPSLAGTDDFWHIGQGYMGRAMESAAYLVYPEEGRKTIVYSSK